MPDIDTSTAYLEENIDAAAEQNLAMTAQFGSQAETVMNQLSTGAAAQRQEFEEDMMASTSGPTADALAELTTDYDAMVGGIQREMMLSQQATLDNINYQQAATQNYMEMMTAQLPALEARLQSQIDAAGRGAGGGTGPSPYLFDEEPADDDPPVDEKTPAVDPELLLGNEYAGIEYTEEEKHEIAKEIGMNYDDLWGEKHNSFLTDVIGRTADPDRGKWFGEAIESQLGMDKEDVEALWNEIGVIKVDEFTGEIVSQPDWFIQKGTLMADSLINSGMDPQQAHDYALGKIMEQMDTQYADEEKKHDPEKYQGWIDDLKWAMNYQLQGTYWYNNISFGVQDKNLWEHNGDVNNALKVLTDEDGQKYYEIDGERFEFDSEDLYLSLAQDDNDSPERAAAKEKWRSANQGAADQEKYTESIETGRNTPIDPNLQKYLAPPTLAPNPTEVAPAGGQNIGDVWAAIDAADPVGRNLTDLEGLANARRGISNFDFNFPEGATAESLENPNVTRNPYEMGASPQTVEGKIGQSGAMYDEMEPDLQDAIKALAIQSNIPTSNTYDRGASGSDAINDLINQQRAQREMAQIAAQAQADAMAANRENASDATKIKIDEKRRNEAVEASNFRIF